MSVSLLHKLPGILLLGILLVGCTEDPGAKPDDPSAPQLTLSVPELNYADDGGIRTVVIRSNTGWTVSGANDWCTTDKAEGSYDGEVTVTTQANTDYDDRSVNLTVKAGSVTKILTVNQRKKDALTLTQARYEIRQEGGAIAVEVKHNVDFTVEIPQEFAGWITPITTKGLSAASLQFEIAANPAYDAREGKIIIRNSNGTLADTLYVVQAQLDKLGITESQRTVAPEGGTVAVAVNTNLDYDIIIPEEAAWITLAPQTKGLRSEEYQFIVAAHTDYNSRSAEVIFKDRNSPAADTLHLLQTSYKADITLGESESLGSRLSDEELKVIKTLILRGHLSDADFSAMRDRMPLLTDLDLYATDCPWIPHEAFCKRNGGLYVGHPSLTRIILPHGATHIESLAFGYSGTLQSIRLPKTFALMDDNTSDWYKRSGLQSITVEAGNPNYSDIDGVLYSANRERLICYPMGRTASSYAVPEGTVALNASFSSSALTSIHIPASVTSMSGGTFGGCPNLATISIDASNTMYCDVNGVVFSKDKRTIIRYPRAKGTAYSIPNGVTTIGESAFAGSRFVTMDIPQGVTTIGESAFASCSQLTAVNIPQGVTAIEASAFYGCRQLTSVTLPNSITKLGNSAFMRCGLTHLTIPEGVTELGANLCQESAQLKSVILPGTLVSLGGSFGPFAVCPQLESITCYAVNPPTGSLRVATTTDSDVQVYVPAASVEAYKAAPGWNNRTNIQAITN